MLSNKSKEIQCRLQLHTNAYYLKPHQKCVCDNWGTVEWAYLPYFCNLFSTVALRTVGIYGF